MGTHIGRTHGALITTLAMLGLLSGCTSETATSPGEAPPAAENGLVSPSPARPQPGPSEEPAAKEQSIRDVRRPGSTVPASSRVRLDGPTILVTATSRDTVWIQEAGPVGTCEASADLVAFRAIEVKPRAGVPHLVEGQHLAVEGRVEEKDRRRTIVDAVLTVGEVGDPYVPHCMRDGIQLASDALDGLLVLTAGTTENTGEPLADGSWSLATCFDQEMPWMTVGTTMFTRKSRFSQFYWVRGVMSRHDAGAVLLPRNADDVLERSNNDVCL